MFQLDGVASYDRRLLRPADRRRRDARRTDFRRSSDGAHHQPAATAAVSVVYPGPRRGGGWRRRLLPHRLDRQHAPPLLGQLGARLRVRVEQREVGHDHRNRKRYRQDAGQRAERADEHADVGLGRHVAVADGRHRLDGPPQTDRDRREVVGRVVLDALGVVDQGREDDDADDQEEDEQRQLVRARLERVYEDLEPGRVARQLEQPHDADDAEELEDVVLLQRIALYKLAVLT